MPITSAIRSCLGEHAGLSWFVAVHLAGHRAPLFAPVAAIVSIDVPGDPSGIDRLFDGLIGAATGLVTEAVFARSSVCGPAVAATGTGARGATS